jgi:hypothetical protein
MAYLIILIALDKPSLNPMFQVLFKLPPTGLVSLLVSVVLRTLLTACALAVVIAVSDFALMMGESETQNPGELIVESQRVA